MMGLRGGADVVVATRAACWTCCIRNALDIARVETLVLDEADRLLDLGFAAELDPVLAALPARRQTLLFSPPLPRTCRRWRAGLLRDAGAHRRAACRSRGAGDRPAVIEVDAGPAHRVAAAPGQQGCWRRALVFVPRATRPSTWRASCATRGFRRRRCTAR
jgi:superfamily II DNA/RNA helicase